jgi:hypothetical protein
LRRSKALAPELISTLDIGDLRISAIYAEMLLEHALRWEPQNRLSSSERRLRYLHM